MAEKKLTKKDLVIEDEPFKPKDGEPITLKVIKISCDNKTEKALRVLNNRNQNFFHRSSRLGTLEKTDTGFKTDVTGFEEVINGLNYELVEVSSKEVLHSGKIVLKEVKVVNNS